MPTSYSLFKSKFKKSITESIYNEVTTKTGRYYHFLGKENTWTDFLSPFIPSGATDSPGQPQDNFRYDLHVRRDILGTKLISPSDVSYVVPRIDWTYNTAFDMYDDNIGPVSLSGTTEPSASGAIRLEEAKFYVLTSEFNVYKCIDNNYGSKSLIQPTGTETDTFTTSDGYIWKFMYTIPISLRNKFLSVEWMPVITALKSQFYSNGAITSVSIDSPGSNYVTEVVGAGKIVTSSTSNTVTGTDTLFTSQVLPGYILKTITGNQIGIVSVVNSNTSITLLANASTTISTADSFKISPPIPAYAVVTGNGTPEKNPYTINGITGAPSGAGYRVTATPNIAISAPKIISGSQLTATASLTISAAGAVSTVTLQTSGYGYDTSPNAPVITVDPPLGASTTYAYWVGSTVYNTLGAVLQFGGRFYRVTQTGTASTVGPSHITGEATNGGAKLTYIGPDNWTANTPYAQYTILKHENRYYTVTNAGGTTSTTGPVGTVAGTSETNGTCNMVYFGTQAVLFATIIKNTADLTPIISNGQVTGIIINDGGIGFTDGAKIQILDSNHQNTNAATQDSTYAKVSANFSIGNIDTLQANVELLAKKGTIEVIKMVNQGSNYSSAEIEILGDGGLGNNERATASANIVNGKIVSINVLTKGTGYTWTDVMITGNGTGAIARAVMSPLNGHGYDAIDELNANSLAFYSSFSQVKNQGLVINNDYRKAGLLRNINYFNSTKKYDKVDGSGCILITGKFDSSKLAYDMLLFKQEQEADNNNYKKYRIVEFTSTQILLSVFNNFTIAANDILLTTSKTFNPDGSVSEVLNGNIIAVESVSERTIDQFSGDMLFLTVRESFQPSEEQTISIRTVVTV